MGSEPELRTESTRERVLALKVNEHPGLARDFTRPALRHALARIPERGNRVLRVVYNVDVNPPRVVTAYFDRRQRGKP